MSDAKKVNPDDGRTTTIIGTPHFSAPEIIKGKGYSFAVDIWALGVCLYDFFCGGLPFGEEKESPYDIYEEILKHPLSFPPYFQNEIAKSLISQLLLKNPDER